MDLSASGDRLLVLRACPIANLDKLSILRCRGVDLLALLFQYSKLALEVGQLTAAGAIFVKSIGLGPEIDKAPAKMGEAAPREKKKLAETAWAGEIPPPAGPKFLVAERKNGGVETAIN